MSSSRQRFHTNHGDNICLSNGEATATWNPSAPYTWLYSGSPLLLGYRYSLVTEGSGMCEMGIIKENPNGKTRQFLLIRTFFTIRQHKRQCSIDVSLNTKGDKVLARYEEDPNKPTKTESVTLKTGEEAWIAVRVKFGHLSFSIHRKGLENIAQEFSLNHGCNIRLEDNHRKAVTKSSNPAALCFLRHNLVDRETITLQCKPLKSKDREPSKYHVKIMAHHSDLGEDADVINYMNGQHKPPFTDVEVLENGDCKGDITCSVRSEENGGFIFYYTSASNKQNSQRLRFPTGSRGVWLIFRLFRTELHLPDQYQTLHDTDVVDAAIREPRNEDGANTMDPVRAFSKMSLSRQHSDFLSVNSCTDLKRVVSINQMSDVENPSFAVEHRFANLERRVDFLEACACSHTHFNNDPPFNTQKERSFANELSVNIQKNWTELIRVIPADTLSDHLFEKRIFTDNDRQNVMDVHKNNQLDANRTLLNILLKKNFETSVLKEVLQESESSHLISLFLGQ